MFLSIGFPEHDQQFFHDLDVPTAVAGFVLKITCRSSVSLRSRDVAAAVELLSLGGTRSSRPSLVCSSFIASIDSESAFRPLPVRCSAA